MSGDPQWIPAFAHTFLSGTRLGYQTSLWNGKNQYTVDPNTKVRRRDFADDLYLLSQKLQHMQEKMIALQSVSATVGLKINTGKTREMRIHARDGNPIHAGNEDIQQADNFTYLGSIVSMTGGT